MLNLPRIFRRANSDDPESLESDTGPPVDAAGPVLSVEPQLSLATSDEVAALDRLYQEALDAMEAVETELNRTNELLCIRDDGDDEQPAAAEPIAPPAGVQPKVMSTPTNIESSGPRVSPTQIIEAALFVGGGPLTIKKLCALLKGEFEHDYVESAVEQLNLRYTAENRPYEICFGTGGYRMELREAFETVQNRVLGLGPRDVRLGQDALEILSLVAYQQPITRADLDSLVKDNPGNILRQLLQRQLISLHREAGEKGEAQEVSYRTTPRFLQVFGLASLAELPQSEELSFK